MRGGCVLERGVGAGLTDWCHLSKHFQEGRPCEFWGESIRNRRQKVQMPGEVNGQEANVARIAKVREGTGSQRMLPKGTF